MTATTSALTWAPDAALNGFEARTIALPADYEGPVQATLVRRRAPGDRAVLYIHGFTDYFFQDHMAQAYIDQGLSFYALDLRKHGRSLLPHQRPNFCKDLREYFGEIDAAIDIIAREDGHSRLLLSGHSTGGLTAALYAHAGARRRQVGALFLNSPFFEFNVDPLTRALTPLLVAIGAGLPDLAPGALSPLYGQSLHRDYGGAWEFDLRWKPIAGFPARLGWVRAVYAAQRQLQAGLAIAQPILLMHAARSGGGKAWNESFTNSDCVLDVAHMRRFGPGLGGQVRMVSIAGGLHDLTLSAPPAREQVFAELFGWLGRAMP
jgi:alpha-beta hydrolase superfamily lysophospholipase